MGLTGLVGKQGPEGKPGPFTETLPSGETETGTWAIKATSEDEGALATSISFSIPLAVALSASQGIGL